MSKSSLAVFCLLFFTVSFGVAAMAALIPSVARHFVVDEEYALRLTWLYMLPYGLFALVWAPLTRVIKIKHLLTFTTSSFFLSALLFSLSGNIHQAFVFRSMMGIFSCSFVPAALITIGKVVDKRKKSKYIGTLFSLSYISTLVSVFLSGFINWRVIYIAAASLGAAALAAVIFFLDDFDFRRQKFKISYAETFKDKRALRLFAAIVLGSFLYHSFQQRLGVYLSSGFGLKQVIISSVFTIATLSAVCFEFGGGFLGARFGNIKITRCGFIVMSLFMLLLLVFKKYQLIFITVVLWGGGWALTHVGLSSYLAQLPDKVLRDASGLNSSLRFFAGGIGAWFGAALLPLIGFGALFGVVGVSLFLLGLYIDKFISERKESYG